LQLDAKQEREMPEGADPEVGDDSLGLIEQPNTILRELESEEARLAEGSDAEAMDYEKSSSEELLKSRHDVTQLEGLLDDAIRKNTYYEQLLWQDVTIRRTKVEKASHIQSQRPLPPMWEAIQRRYRILHAMTAKWTNQPSIEDWRVAASPTAETHENTQP